MSALVRSSRVSAAPLKIEQYPLNRNSLENILDPNICNEIYNVACDKFIAYKKLQINEVKFFNIRNHKDLPYKLHLFCEGDQVRVYMKDRKYTKQPSTFKAYCPETLRLTFSVNEMPAIKKVTRLVSKIVDKDGNLRHVLERRLILEKIQDEIKILRQFKGIKGICQILDGVKYTGCFRQNENELPQLAEKVVLYEDDYPQGLIEIISEGVLKNNEEKVKIILTGILEGVNEIHNKGYIHRDLKPENIRLNDNEIVICDFDAAEDKPQNDNCKEGTPQYISPERFLSLVLKEPAKEVTQASDMWSVGCILYYMWTSIEPFWGVLQGVMDELETMHSALNEMQPPSEHASKSFDESPLKDQLKQLTDLIKELTQKLKIEEMTSFQKLIDPLFAMDIAQIEQTLNEYLKKIAKLTEEMSGYNQKQFDCAKQFLLQSISELGDLVRQSIHASWQKLHEMPEPESYLIHNLMWKMLRPDSNKRISVKEALEQCQLNP